jgi:hypothetical protein
MSFSPISLAQAFQTDRGKRPLVGVHLTAMFSSGDVCFARGPIAPTPPVSNQTQQGPVTFQGLLLATYCDRIETFTPPPPVVGTIIIIDGGVQRFSRKKADMILFKISPPVILDGSPYIGQIKFDDAATEWTQIKLSPQWNFLTGTTGTLQGEQVTYSLSFVEYP